LNHNGRLWLGVEFCAIFLGLPFIFFFHPTRWDVHLAIWTAGLYGLLIIKRQSNFSWRELWHGTDWAIPQRKMALVRFCTAVPLIILLTYTITPEHIFDFPLRRPWFWLLVMVLYPILSVIPQELVFRTFFFRRYGPLFRTRWALIAASGIVFGFAHVVFHNPVSPTLSAIGGLMFASSYNQHRALKWAVVEHAAYGCMIFTVGLGFYFLVGGFRH